MNLAQDEIDLEFELRRERQRLQAEKAAKVHAVRQQTGAAALDASHAFAYSQRKALAACTVRTARNRASHRWCLALSPEPMPLADASGAALIVDCRGTTLMVVVAADGRAADGLMRCVLLRWMCAQSAAAAVARRERRVNEASHLERAKANKEAAHASRAAARQKRQEIVARKQEAVRQPHQPPRHETSALDVPWQTGAAIVA